MRQINSPGPHFIFNCYKFRSNLQKKLLYESNYESNI